MHLSKSSFYDTFGSKHNFLLTALTHYSDVIVGQIAGDLQKGSALAAISRSFDLALNPPGKVLSRIVRSSWRTVIREHVRECARASSASNKVTIRR